MSKCPFCQSENTEDIDINRSLTFGYEIKEDNSSKGGKINFPYVKTLCLNCGMIHEHMKEEVLKEYNDMKPYLL